MDTGNIQRNVREREAILLLGLVISGKEVAVVDRDMGTGCSARYCCVFSVANRVYKGISKPFERFSST